MLGFRCSGGDGLSHGLAINRVLQEPVFFVAFRAEGVLDRLLAALFEDVPLADGIGVVAGQEFDLLVNAVGGAEDGAKLVRVDVEITQIAEFRAKLAGVLRIAQEKLLELGRTQDGGELIAGLLAQAGQGNGVGWLAGLLLGGEIGTHPGIGAGDQFLEGGLNLGGEGAQLRAVQGDAFVGGAGEINQVARLPIGAQQAGEQREPLVFQLPDLPRGRANNIQVGFAPPPLLERRNDLASPPARIEGVDVGHDDVPNGLFGAGNIPEVGDIGGVVAGFQLPPTEELAAHEDIRAGHARNGWIRQLCGSVATGTVGKVPPPRRQQEIDSERCQSESAPTHIHYLSVNHDYSKFKSGGRKKFRVVFS